MRIVTLCSLLSLQINYIHSAFFVSTIRCVRAATAANSIITRADLVEKVSDLKAKIQSILVGYNSLIKKGLSKEAVLYLRYYNFETLQKEFLLVQKILNDFNLSLVLPHTISASGNRDLSVDPKSFPHEKNQAEKKRDKVGSEKKERNFGRKYKKFVLWTGAISTGAGIGCVLGRWLYENESWLLERCSSCKEYMYQWALKLGNNSESGKETYDVRKLLADEGWVPSKDTNALEQSMSNSADSKYVLYGVVAATVSLYCIYKWYNWYTKRPTFDELVEQYLYASDSYDVKKVKKAFNMALKQYGYCSQEDKLLAKQYCDTFEQLSLDHSRA